MRHITENKISSITADSENSNYPIANTQDTHPSKPWKAADGVTQATLIAEVNYGISDVAIFGTNAVSATVAASDPNEMAWGGDDEWGSSEFLTDAEGNLILDGNGSAILTAEGTDLWGNTPITTPAVTQYQRSASKALWLELGDTIGRPARLSITLTAPEGETLYAGIVQSSIAKTYGGKNPQYGLSIDMDDTSIEREMSNATRFYKKRNVLRMYTITVLMGSPAAFELIDFFQRNGAIATPWKVTDLTGDGSNEWVVFGKMSPPAAGYNYVGRATINTTITEVL